MARMYIKIVNSFSKSPRSEGMKVEACIISFTVSYMLTVMKSPAVGSPPTGALDQPE